MSAQQYHRLTSYRRDKMPMHFLDWKNQPSVFKTYPGAADIQLPTGVKHHGKALSTVLKSPASAKKFHIPNLDDLSRIFALSYSITAKGGHGGGYHYYRSVASAGALYPCEIYVCTRGVQGLHDGLYHFSVSHHALTLLRKGDFSVFVAENVQPVIENSPVMTFFFSAIFFRSAWKYLERSYRYHLLDTGHLLENMIIALKAQAFPFVFSPDFDDHELNRLLGLDVTKEVCLAVCSVPGVHPFESAPGGEKISELPEAVKNASLVSLKEAEYHAVLKTHEQGIHKIAQPRAEFPPIDPVGLKPIEIIDIICPETWSEQLNCAGAFSHRRSKRNFIPKPMSYKCLTALLQCLSFEEKGIRDYHNTVRTGLIVGSAEGIDPGFYLIGNDKRSIEQISSGNILENMAHICLDQKWLANAAVHFVFLTDIEMLENYYGARGYRYAMMISGRKGERLYLAATAMAVGCCGIGAFYDFEAAQLLGLTINSRLLYLVAVGPVKAM